MSVPIIVDSAGSEVVRCTYFCIENTEPQPNWTLTLNQGPIPILLIGLSAVVVDSLNRRRFHSGNDIEALFAQVESTPGLSVEISDIWLPTFLFRGAILKRGMVFRLDRPAFGRAFAQGLDGFEPAAWEIRPPEALEFSPEETNAFMTWGQTTIKLAQEMFPKNAELKLQRRGPDLNFRRLPPPPEPPAPSFDR